jgi:hypothetical protein
MPGSSLYIFDFDDTLVKSESEVVVNKSDGSELKLTSHEYATYVPDHDDQFDFSQFNTYPKNPKIISSTWNDMLAALIEVGSDRVIILTARANPEPIREFLRDNNVSPFPVVVAVGDSDPSVKKHYVQRVVKQLGITDIILYEDSINNISAIESLENDNLRIDTTRVQESVIRKIIASVIKEIAR